MATNGNGTKVELRPSDMTELGSADDGNPFGRVFSRYEGGRVFDMPDPGADEFETMLIRDGKARSIEQALTLPLRWAELVVEPQEGDRGEAEYVREALTRPANSGGMSTPVELVVAQMSSAVTRRRAFFEKVFKVDDEGRLVYDKLAFRPARTCTIERDAKTRAFRGFTQQVRDGDGTSRDVRIAPQKAFVYLHGQHRDPLRGSSEMDTVYSCFESKQKVRFLWFQFLERRVIPHAVLKTKEADRPARAKQVAKLAAGGVIALDKDEELDAFESGTGAAEAFKDAMDWLSAEQSGSVMASFLDLAQQGSGKGSFALSKDQTDLFLRSRLATLQEMGAALTSWVGADLVRFVFGPSGRAPKVRLRLPEDDAQEARDLFQSLAAQQVPNPRVPVEFMDLLTEKVAGHIGLDVDKVRGAIEARVGGARSPSDGLRAGIAAAAQLVQEAGVSPQADAAPTPAG